MAEIIASILVRDVDATLQRARQAATAGADWIELRLDRWPLSATLDTLIQELPLPAIVTCRTPRDGGEFAGTLAERRELFERALAAGAVGIDLEDWEAWRPQRTGKLRLVIRSHHNLTGVTPDLAGVRDRLLAQDAQLAKIACVAHDLADAAPILDLLAATEQAREPTVAFALGKTAWPTRVLGALLGARLVYGSVQEGEETGPGQIPVSLLAGLYDVRALGPGTALFGLLGNPALHSLGPWLHNRALRRLEAEAVYLPFETSRPEVVLAMLPRRRLRGLSVTAPFKKKLAAHCHRLDGAAATAGVVNTITYDAGGMVVGHNTDVPGIQRALQDAGFPARAPGARAAVLGAGGSARAAALALRELGCAVTIFARSLEAIRDFARRAEMPLANLRADLLRDLDPRVVVHATPVGTNAPDERILPDWSPRAGCFVLDLVYRPQRTRLLRDAEQAGAIPVSGLAAFLAQAEAQLELFTGQSLPAADLARFVAGA